MSDQNQDSGIDLSALEAVSCGIVAIDRNLRIVFANRTIRTLTKGSPPAEEEGISCHAYLFDRSEPCDDCPLAKNSGDTGVRSAIIRSPDSGEEIFVKEQVQPVGDRHLITLVDVTREVSLLRRIDLTRKEQQAKNILLERRRKEILDEQHFLKDLLDNLPQALVTVDPTFTIEGRNRSVAKLLPSQDAQKCYELFGQHTPCPGCPAINGFEELQDLRKTHRMGDRYLTESISRLPFGIGGLLLFRDTTREIRLIEQIRGQQQTIVRKNEILDSLAQLGTIMQKESNLEAVIEIFWELFFSLVKREAALLLVNDIRPGHIWHVAQRGVGEEMRQPVIKAFLGRDMQTLAVHEIDRQHLPWPKANQIVLKGRGGELVGLLIVQGEPADQEEQEIIELFIEPLAAYIDNRLLSRKLEEKANTDPLTGLYNRGYLEQAIREETEKYESLGIDFALVVGDVNQLKKANDLHGHEFGDRLIKMVSRRLGEAIRTSDILARTGGDEFVILLTDACETEAQAFVERLTRHIFHDVYLETGDGESFPVTLSLGAAASDSCPPGTILKEADRAMYMAKQVFYQHRQRYR